MFISAPGVAFLAPSEQGRHLHFIITPPLDGKVLVVGITSSSVDRDFTLNPGDHEFIRHESFINYPAAEIIPVEEIERKLNSSDDRERFIPKKTADMDVVEHVCRGLMESGYSLRVHREFYETARGRSKFRTDSR